MRFTPIIPSGAAELRDLSPAEWFALKERVAREAHAARNEAIRGFFRRAMAMAVAVASRLVRAVSTTAGLNVATRAPRPIHPL